MAYKMPKVEIGDVVCWHIDAAPSPEHAHAATVTGIHPEHVDLSVLMPGRNPAVRTSVRHVSDPRLKDIDPKFRLDSGGWDYSPMMKRLMAVEAALGDLSKSRSK